MESRQLFVTEVETIMKRGKTRDYRAENRDFECWGHDRNMTGKEWVDMMQRRKVDILFVQETRWKGSFAVSSEPVLSWCGWKEKWSWSYLEGRVC